MATEAFKPFKKRKKQKASTDEGPATSFAAAVLGAAKTAQGARMKRREAAKEA